MTTTIGNSIKLGPLIGHESQRREVEQALQSGLLHHGWLFQGPRGIGKSRFALLFGAALLNGRNTLDYTPDDQATHLIETESHPDFLYVGRPFDDKGKQKTDIPVDAIRKLGHFFSLKPAMGGWRIAVIDSVDDLNASSANALLKTLEEPPARSVLILTSHGEKPSLPTLRSRCRKLVFNPLTHEQTLSVLGVAGLSAADAASSADFAPGQPGRGLKLVDKVIMSAIHATRGALKGKANTKSIKEAMSAASRSEEAFRAAFSMVRREALSAARTSATALQSGEWARLYAILQKLESETLALNMDKSQAISSALLQFKKYQSAHLV